MVHIVDVVLRATTQQGALAMGRCTPPPLCSLHHSLLMFSPWIAGVLQADILSGEGRAGGGGCCGGSQLGLLGARGQGSEEGKGQDQ